MENAKTNSFLWVFTFAYFGVALRLFITYLTTLLPGTLIATLGPSYFLPNIIGTFALGISTSMQPKHSTFWLPVLNGINSGFCGSLTTFSTWQCLVGIKAVNGKWLDGLVESLLVFTTCYTSLLAGKHFGICLGSYAHQERTSKNIPQVVSPKRVMPLDKEPKKTEKSNSLFLLPFIFCLVASLSNCTLCLVDHQRKSIWLTVAFGPFGALLRYLISFGNSKTPNFPLFTFIANEVATTSNILIVILFNILKPSASATTLSSYELWVRQAISVGFMGSLSTVSTWVNELHRLSRRKTMFNAYRYGILSVLISQSLVIASQLIYINMYQSNIKLE